ncbi:hypothetical protein LSAT2_025468 [Lamellibrachia satsuma]|nr:hypothetical protein LSAT2_025468 [Lamellibrachia satsuma]
MIQRRIKRSHMEVFQRRLDGSVDFYRGWGDYKNGFGSTSGEFWLGNDNIHSLTSRGRHILRIDMEAFGGETKFAEYTNFSLDSGSTNYAIRFGEYLASNTARNTLSHNNNMPFSTKDADHDTSPFSCSRRFQGAWWYGYCSLSNLNGHYYQEGESVSQFSGIMWSTWTGFYGSLKRATMKMRPAEFTPGEKLMQ